MANKKILVIGGAGYIGSHVVKSLLREDFSVTVYDNLSTGQTCNLFKNAEFVEGDILDEAHLEKVMSGGFDAVIHLAAKKAVGESMENPQLYSQNNISGSINIFKAGISLNLMIAESFPFSFTCSQYSMSMPCGL